MALNPVPILPRKVQIMDKGSPTWLWRSIIVAAVIVIGFFDWLTGYELDFLLFYFLPITLGGWFLWFGELLTLAFICTAVWAGADFLSGHEYSSYFILVWNSLIRLVAFLAIGGAVHKIRYLLDHEREITEALHEARNELEEKVRERTKDLHLTVTKLQEEVIERREAEEALKESEERLRYLASQLLNAQEKERARIAHELHDGLGQSLLLLKLQLSGITRGLPPELEKSRQECFNSLNNVQGIIDSVRHLSQDLIPPALSETGLKSALNDLLDEFSRCHNITCSADIDEMKVLMSPTAEMNIYRMLQESLTNIGKHAQATQVSVFLKRNDHEVWFSVEDNGIGFEVDKIQARQGRKRGLGIGSLDERARMMGGTFHIWSKPNSGTKIHLTLPLKSEALT
jgi:signal transduction histidine kinase